ncbi:hypothetical protein U5F73_05240 [Stenotrophomonas pavanii]|uniref:hypothetical protein n=1 Tax=Stenotrophomonas pavanii TaxID=487698 RepID=UPI0018D38521|nr:hypothetical protein [Stenotrophomonas pavanii]MBH1540564.1 hypothetical protein [Stenotrophomonas maltophilia]MDZ7474410.1 hypothetical protein [Stenotrophomonas pavanii]
MSTVTTYALVAALTVIVVAARVYAFGRDAESERIKTAKVLRLAQALPATRPCNETAAKAEVTLPKIETSAFSDTDDAYRRNHVSVIGERDGFCGKNNIGPP